MNNTHYGGEKKLGKNIAIITIGSFSSRILTFLLVPFYTSILTTEEYGIYDLVISAVNLIFPVVSLLISEAVVRFALDRNSNKAKIFTLSLIVTAIEMVVFLCFSPLILLSSTLKNYYFFFVLYFITHSIYMLVFQFVRGIEKMKQYAIAGALSTMLVILLNILLLAVFRIGLTGYFVANIASSFIGSVYLFLKCRLYRYIVPLHKEDKALLVSMLKYSVPLIPNGLSWWINTSSDKFFITYYFDAGASGLYAVAYKIPSLLTTFTNIMLNAWQISAVEDFGTEKATKFYTKIYNYYFTVTASMVAVIIAFTKFLSGMLFQKEFFEAWVFVPILMAAYFFHDLSAFIATIYTTAKKTKMLSYTTALGAVINVILNFLLIPKWGAVGAAGTTLISYFIVWGIRMIHSRTLMKLEYSYCLDILSMILLGAEIAVIYLLPKHALLIMIVIAAAVILMRTNLIIQIAKDFFPLNRIRQLIRRNEK